MHLIFEGFWLLCIYPEYKEPMQKRVISAEETNDHQWYLFKNSRWGRLHDTIPWDELEACLPEKKNKSGPKPYFDNKGMFALMFLKHELGVSDEALIEHINTNVCLQLFCHMRLAPFQCIKDTGIVSRIRSYIGHQADLSEVQSVLVEYWREDIEVEHFLKLDATCMESYIRFPTDVKLLWECCEWIYARQLFPLRKHLKIRLGKEKERYDVQKKKYVSYGKLRRKSHKKTRKRIKSLLNLLHKGLQALQQLLNQHLRGSLKPAFYQRLKTIRLVYRQQYYLFKHPGTKVKNRIVSLYKPYIRPIKRGKENKPTEFGAKVHMMQVDGINIIEHISFSAFNEGKRLKACVKKHKSMFGACNQVSADAIYATNENRNYCRKQHIFTGFIPKGPKPGKQVQHLKAALNKDRATRLEGSFGNEKNHYSLGKVKARNQHTEITWIYFGVFTANAMQIASKRKRRQQIEATPLPQLQAA